MCPAITTPYLNEEMIILGKFTGWVLLLFRCKLLGVLVNVVISWYIAAEYRE